MSRWEITGDSFRLVLGLRLGVGRAEPCIDPRAALRLFDLAIWGAPRGSLAAREVERCARALVRFPDPLGDARERVREALRRGTLRAWRVERRAALGGADRASAEEAVPLASTLIEKTWIEIELLGEDDLPIPGAAYSVTLPDGSVKEGRLDNQGRAYFGGLDPGAAEVRWPDLDRGAVADRGAQRVTTGGGATAAGRSGGIRAPQAVDGSLDEKTWIEIELLGEDDLPVPGAAYWVRTPDGIVHEGVLAANGRARFEGLDPGTAEIRWPSLDDGAVEDRAAERAPAPASSVGTVAIARALNRPTLRGGSVRARDWIEIELLGEDGRPLPNEAYELRLPDGEVRAGRLDARGHARIDDITAGCCEVRWPDLDQSALRPPGGAR